MLTAYKQLNHLLINCIVFSFFLLQLIILYTNLFHNNCLNFQVYHIIDQHLQMLSTAIRLNCNVFGFTFKSLHNFPQPTVLTLFLLKLYTISRETVFKHLLNFSYFSTAFILKPSKNAVPHQLPFTSQDTGEFPPSL